MDWYYPVLAGVVSATRRTGWPIACTAFVMDGCGVRCVSDRPWVTVAETCECAMANLAVGNAEVATDLFRWAQQCRTDDGRYWTGTVFPDEGRFPTGERSTYTASAVVLAADALAGRAGSPASGLFTRHDTVLLRVIETADADSSVTRRGLAGRPSKADRDRSGRRRVRAPAPDPAAPAPYQRPSERPTARTCEPTHWPAPR